MVGRHLEYLAEDVRRWGLDDVGEYHLKRREPNDADKIKDEKENKASLEKTLSFLTAQIRRSQENASRQSTTTTSTEVLSSGIRRRPLDLRTVRDMLAGRPTQRLGEVQVQRSIVEKDAHSKNVIMHVFCEASPSDFVSFKGHLFHLQREFALLHSLTPEVINAYEKRRGFDISHIGSVSIQLHVSAALIDGTRIDTYNPKDIDESLACYHQSLQSTLTDTVQKNDLPALAKAQDASKRYQMTQDILQNAQKNTRDVHFFLVLGWARDNTTLAQYVTSLLPKEAYPLVRRIPESGDS